jgi:hypothetical protein
MASADAGHVLGEAYSGGALGGLALTNIFDGLFRRTHVITKNGGTTLSSATCTYDTGFAGDQRPRRHLLG